MKKNPNETVFLTRANLVNKMRHDTSRDKLPESSEVMLKDFPTFNPGSRDFVQLPKYRETSR